MATKTATPWGPASLVEELTVPQRSGDKRFASVVQLLENAKGERLVRFAYSTGGTARRGPVTLRARDVERLVSSLAGCPQLAELLGFGGKEGAEENGEPTLFGPRRPRPATPGRAGALARDRRAPAG